MPTTNNTIKQDQKDSAWLQNFNSTERRSMVENMQRMSVQPSMIDTRVRERTSMPIKSDYQRTFSDSVAEAKRKEDANPSLVDIFGMGAATSAIAAPFRAIHHSNPVDETFNAMDKYDETYEQFGPRDTKWLMDTDSAEEYNSKRTELGARKLWQGDIQDAGTSGTVASLAGSLAADLAIPWSPSMAAYRMTQTGNAVRRVLQGGALGAAEGYAYTAGTSYGDNSIDDNDAALWAMVGGVLGGSLNKFAPELVSKKAQTRAASENVMLRDKGKDITKSLADEQDAIKASILGQDVTNPFHKARTEWFSGELRFTNAIDGQRTVDGINMTEFSSLKFNDLNIQKYFDESASRFGELGYSEFSQLMRGSPAEQLAASMLLDSPQLGAIQNKTAASYKEVFRRQMEKPLVDIDMAFKEYRKAMGHKQIPGTELFFTNPLSGVSQDSMESFGVEVMRVLAKWDNGITDVTAHPSIIKAAESYSQLNAKALEIMQNVGDSNFAVLGSESIRPNKGYFPVRWNYMKMSEFDAARNVDNGLLGGAIAESRGGIQGKVATKQLPSVQAIADAYQARAGSTMSREVAEDIAAEVYQKSFGKSTGIHKNAEDVDEAMAYINRVANGEQVSDAMTVEQALKIKNHIHSGNGNHSSAAFLNSRTPINLNSDGIFDMIDTNLIHLMRGYVEDVSGMSGLARKGLRSKPEIDEWISEVAAQAKLHGSSTTLTDLQDIIYAGFTSRPNSAALSPAYRRIQQGMNASLLGGLGWMQAGEGINQMIQQFQLKGAAGLFDQVTVPWKTFKLGATEKSQMVREFEDSIGILMGTEHRVLRQAVQLDDKFGSTIGPKMKMFDHQLNAANHAVGTMSGFHTVRSRQQIMGLEMFLGNMEHLSKQGTPTKQQFDIMRRWGMDEELFGKLSNEIKRNAVYSDSGKLESLGSAAWNKQTLDDITHVYIRNQDQIIQSAHQGESALFLSRGAGSFLSSLLKFPLVANEKQLARNLRLGVGQTVMQGIYSYMLLSQLYTARMAATYGPDSEKFDDLTSGPNLWTGAMMMSPIAGYLPNILQILAGLSGQGPDEWVGRYNTGNFLSSNVPVLGFGEKFIRGVSESASSGFTEDHQFFNRNMMTTMPFNSMMGIRTVINNMDD